MSEVKPLPISFLSAESIFWNKELFNSTVNAAIDVEGIELIGKRRKELKSEGSQLLHESYAQAGPLSHSSPEVTVEMVSLPPRYGMLIYNILQVFGACHVVEAGSGFGISSMYIASSLKENGKVSGQPTSLISFELAGYASKAQTSIDVITDGNRERARVVQADFCSLGSYLPATQTIDVAFIDSRHDYDTLLRSYKSTQGWMASRAMILIDDIGYSDETRAAWEHLVSQNDYSFAALINGRMGVLSD